jgi:hypothetical protein
VLLCCFVLWRIVPKGYFRKKKPETSRPAGEWAVSIPTHENPVVVGNPFRGIFIAGAAGSGKSESVAVPLLLEFIRKGFAGIVYDFKFPALDNDISSFLNATGSDLRHFRLNFSNPYRTDFVRPIQLEENVKLLKEVEVKGTAAQLVVKGDTLEYNATAFKTQENAVVEDLLKKLPGVEISSDGKIMVNGEEVKKIRLDGKKFFDGDIEQATKNLSADMIEKIQVLEQKSDMAQLTGFEDGDTERIINLTTKPNRKKGVNGNVNGGAGADINKNFRYDSGLSLNILNGESQTSINAGANNLNNTRSSRGRGSWGGGSNAGITTSQNFGLNNNSMLSKKTTIGGDITFNHSNNFSNTESNRTSYLSSSTYNDLSNSISENDKYDANMRLELEWKIDSLQTFILQPNINYSTSDSYTERKYSYLTDNDSTSWGNSINNGTNNSLSGGLNLIYNKKSAVKKGRSFTINLNTDFSRTNGESYNLSNKYTNDTTINIDQQTKNISDRFSAGMRMSFVEPLWNNKNMIEAAVSVNTTTTTSEKNQYSYDATKRDYSIFDEEYSNNFENEFFRESIELNYRFTEKTYNVMLGLSGQTFYDQNCTGIYR